MRKPRQIIEYGHEALLVQWQQQIDPQINDSVHAYAGACLSLSGVQESVPAYCSLLVTFDPNLTTANRLREQIYDLQPKVKPMSGRKHLLPVCYGGDFGPDLEEAAENLKIKPKQLVELHQATSYRVYQLGYQPGFAFLGLTDPKLEIERRQSPRSKVPAGSVGLAGRQTGIYPMEAPGGWQLIGRCPWSMIRTDQEPFARLQAGDIVEFFAIEAKEWAEYLKNQEPWID